MEDKFIKFILPFIVFAVGYFVVFGIKYIIQTF